MDSNRKAKTLILSLLLCTTFFKGIVTGIIVPTFEFPDEQAHFGMVSHLVEKGNNTGEYDLSREIYLTELSLGTARNQRGINQYTYKRDFKPVYTNFVDGFYETEIKDLPLESRTEFVKTEAARYPRLFYDLTSIGYRLSYSSDIYTRLFFSRLVSVLITVFSVYVAYLLGKKVFNTFLGGISLGGLISFHPMFSFVSSGVNNDNLTNLWGLLLLLLCAHLIKDGLDYKKSLGIGIISGLGILTKPLILPLLLGVGGSILFEWYLSKRKFNNQIKLLTPLIIGGILAGGYKIILPILETGNLPYITNAKADSSQSSLSILTYTKNQLGLYYRETLVWYWGVFKWLGVILPLNIIRIIKIGMIISGIGLVKLFLSKKKLLLKSQIFNFLIISFIFIISLSLWDFDMLRKNGFSHGIQGRYFFPTIGAHMAILMTGIWELIPKQFQNKTFKFLSLAMVFLHLISLITLIKAYYPLNSINSLLIIMSQNKSEIIKYPNSILFICIYFGLLGIFLLNLFAYQSSKKNL